MRGLRGFFEAPTRETFRDLVKSHVGELRSCDFKADWPEGSAVAKHILGIANVGGGCLVIGVEELPNKTLSPVGMPSLKDKADVINGIKSYLPPVLSDAIEIGDFSYDAAEYPAMIGKRFQVLFVHPRLDSLPFVCRRDSTNTRVGAIYVRREGLTEEATYEDIQKLLDARLDASPQTAEARGLKDHLEELKVLYSELPREFKQHIYDVAAMANMAELMFTKRVRNPDAPSEEYGTFVRRMLEGKKALIERRLGLSRSSRET